ncbi:PD-(D/E)XK nuclease family protein [Mucilaginibacter antarcticus]|uniref:PD-(D/E)XK nuclease family protein n=1 Tax=Mucilaginibacter antarcticus TaxID=1855725 RepID=A0ABW5XNW9_9SPHI
MIWSISGYKQFNRCERQWYYSNIVSHPMVKNDAFRKEVTVLSKLQTIEAWRGTIVDEIISRILVNAVNRKMPIKKDYFINQAMLAFDNQLEYAVFQKYRLPGSKLNDDPHFAALLDCEYGLDLSDDDLEIAKTDIRTALSNLLDNAEFIAYLQTSKRLISQRALVYPVDRFNVRAIPDMIAFFDNEPPHIFDWKVHTFGNVSYDEQLISYAVALYKVAASKPHSDFPANITEYKLSDYKLTEYQLLHKDRIKRDYEVTNDALEELGDKISSSIMEMYITGCHKKYSQLDAEKFSTTLFFENCLNCPFKRICKSNDHELRNSYLSN